MIDFETAICSKFKMTKSERGHLQKRIVQHYINVANKNESFTVNHFAEGKICRRTLYSIIQKYEDSGHVADRPRSGRPKKLCRGKLSRLKRLVNHKTELSSQRLPSKFEVSHQNILNYLKEMNIKYYKKQKALKYTEKQLQKIKTKAGRLYQMLLSDDVELVMDDEKYFRLSNQSVPTNRGCYSSDKEVTPTEVKLKRMQKYEPNVLVWIAISNKGVSLPFFTKQK